WLIREGKPACPHRLAWTAPRTRAISTGSTTFAIRRLQPPLFKRCQMMRIGFWGVLPGRPLPLAPPCNRQRPFFVAGDRQGCPLFVRAPHCRALSKTEKPRRACGWPGLLAAILQRLLVQGRGPLAHNPK